VRRNNKSNDGKILEISHYLHTNSEISRNLQSSETSKVGGGTTDFHAPKKK